MRLRSFLISLILLLALNVYLMAQQFKSDEGLFTINFHGTPNHHVNKLENGISLHLFSVELEGAAYMVTYSDYEINNINLSSPDELLDRAIEGVSTKGKVTDVQSYFYDEFHGRKFNAVIENPAGSFLTEGRMILVNRRLYQLMVVYSEGESKPDDTETFFDSFKIDQSVNKSKIAQILDKIPYSYEIDSDGDYRVDFSFTEGRTQRVYINYYSNEFETNRMIKVWSPVSNFKGKLADSLYSDVMSFNGRHESCNFQLIERTDDSTMIRLFAVTTIDNSPEKIKELIEHIISYADEFEEKYFRRDWW